MVTISNIVEDYVPNTWQVPYNGNHMVLSTYTEEYRAIKDQLGLENIGKITRIQDIYSFGQCLIRGQLLIATNDGRYYQVRRFIKLSKTDREKAIKYNLDSRRCSLSSLTFTKSISNAFYSDIIAVVQVITDDPNKDYIQPKNSLEYYIEYIVDFN